jgi:hypothetical protein
VSISLGAAPVMAFLTDKCGYLVVHVVNVVNVKRTPGYVLAGIPCAAFPLK